MSYDSERIKDAAAKREMLERIAELDAEVNRLREITEDQLRTITALTEGVAEATGKEGSSAIILYIARLETEVVTANHCIDELESALKAANKYIKNLDAKALEEQSDE